MITMNYFCSRFVILSKTMFLVSALVLIVSTSQYSIASPDELSAQVIFTKEFPNSQPDYFSISVFQDGRASYKTAADDESPVAFKLPNATSEEIFQLASKLGWFKDRKLDSNRRVAFMGKKTLVYLNGADQSQATFNHTEVPEALALTSIFEKISQTQQHLIKIEYLLRFDRLGIVKELLQIEIDLDQGRLVGPVQLLPLLEKIQNDRSLVNVAKDRAIQIIGKIKTSGAD